MEAIIQGLYSKTHKRLSAENWKIQQAGRGPGSHLGTLVKSNLCPALLHHRQQSSSTPIDMETAPIPSLQGFSSVHAVADVPHHSVKLVWLVGVDVVRGSFYHLREMSISMVPWSPTRVAHTNSPEHSQSRPGCIGARDVQTVNLYLYLLRHCIYSLPPTTVNIHPSPSLPSLTFPTHAPTPSTSSYPTMPTT